ncbi:MAG: acyltransferase family protein [Agriterribacter sp.]
MAATYRQKHSWHLQWTNSFVQFQFFAAGILTSVFLKGRQPRWNFATRIVLFITGYGCWLTASMVCEVNADPPHLATIAQSTSGWFLILIGVMCFFFSFFGSAAKHIPAALAYLGRISYGMYVVHITIYWIVYNILKMNYQSLVIRLVCMNGKMK